MIQSSDFIQPDEKNKMVVVKINSKVFPIDLVYEASYTIMDRAYVILDGDPTKEIFVLLKPRTFKGSLEELGQEFYDNLVSSAFHTVQFVRNKEVRDSLIKSMEPLTETESEEDISTLWEEKFGDNVEGDNKDKQ